MGTRQNEVLVAELRPFASYGWMTTLKIHTKSALFGAGLVVLVGVLSAQTIHNRFVAVRVLETPVIETTQSRDWRRIMGDPSGLVTFTVPPEQAFVLSYVKTYNPSSNTNCGSYVAIADPVFGHLWYLGVQNIQGGWYGRDQSVAGQEIVAHSGEIIEVYSGCGGPPNNTWVTGYLVDA